MPINHSNNSEQTKNTKTVTVEKLKQRFSTQTLPTAQDYADLIDMADFGRRAAGLAPDQTDSDSGLWMVDNQLHIGDDAPVALKDGKLGVNITDPFTIDQEGRLAIKLSQEMIVWNNKLAAKQAQGIRSIPGKLEVQLAPDSGLEIEDGALKIKNKIPKNLIIMYHGKTIPEGWALCDGSQGTPDMRDKFILTHYVDISGVAHFKLKGTTLGTLSGYKLVFLMKL